MAAIRFGIFLFLVTISWAFAQEIVVEGQALIHRGDIGQAREQALQRALGVAAATGPAQVSALVNSQPGSVQESTRVTSSICTRSSKILDETVMGDQLTLSVAVTLDAGRDCLPKCQPGYANKVVVTGIPLEFPEQIEPKEKSTIAYDTAVELARKLRNRNQLLTESAEQSFPYTSGTRAPEPFLTTGILESEFVTLAKSRRAQYVVSGVYRDFSIRRNMISWTGYNERYLVLELFVHDGANGSLLSQKRFSRIAKGNVSLKGIPPIGSPAFYASDIGRALDSLFDEAAWWASDTVACLPFIARVLKVEKERIFVDMGGVSRVSSQDTFRLHAWQEPPVTASDGRFLGQEKEAGIRLRLKTVYPEFSIAEIAETPFRYKIQPGDLLYLQ